MTRSIPATHTVDADIAIVGAGPAGATAASHFARAGFRVALLDQRRFTRDKVCGDFVGPVGLAELERLGLLPAFRGANRILHGAFHINGTRVITRPFPRVGGLRDFGLCIPRVSLDDVLAQEAVTSGARLIEEARVTGYETDATGVTLFHHEGAGPKRLRTRLLIGADGSSSLIARTLRGAKPPTRDRIVAVRAYFDGVEGPMDQADLYLHADSFPGYSWVFPTGANSANVGVGVALDVSRPSNQNLSQLLARLIDSDPGLRRRLAKAKMRGKIVGWPLATFNPQSALIADRVALIGDAAGFISPLSGEGIQYALRSARWIAETLPDALSSDRLSAPELRPYAKRAHRELRFDMALSRFIIDLARNRALNPLWLWVLGVMANLGASDSRYYDVTAGGFTGVVRARDVVAFPFVWRAALSTAKALGSSAMRRSWRSRARRESTAVTTHTVGAMLKGLVVQPIMTLKWGVDCALDLCELARQVTISAVG